MPAGLRTLTKDFCVYEDGRREVLTPMGFPHENVPVSWGPEQARLITQPGRVVAACDATRSGEVTGCIPLCSDLPPHLDGAYLDMLERISIEPLRCRGEPVEVKLMVPVKVLPSKQEEAR